MLGVRPESIAVEDSASPESFPVEVVAVTPLNEKTLLLLRTDDGREFSLPKPGRAEAPRRHGPRSPGLIRAPLFSSTRRAAGAFAPQAA